MLHCILLVPLLAAGLLLLTGCQPDPLDELIAESPFTRYPHSQTLQIPIITCRGFNFELPGYADLTTMPFWRQHGLSPASPADPNRPPRSARSPLPPDQLALWHDNGLAVAVAPLDQWPQLRQDILQFWAGRLTKRSEDIFTSATQVANLAVFSIAPAQLLVSGATVPPRTYTLPPGDCIFKVGCAPAAATPKDDTGAINLRISPAFVSADKQLDYTRDEFGSLQRIRRRPEIVFDQLLLQGILKPGTFLCLACPPTSRPDSLGRLFMTQTDQDTQRQQLLVIVPTITQASQIK